MLKTSLTLLNREWQLVTVLKLVVFLLPVLLVAPSASAHTSEAAGRQASDGTGDRYVHDTLADSRPGDLPGELDCRCDKNAVLAGSASDQGKLVVPYCAVLERQELFEIVFEGVRTVQIRPPPPRLNSPPVYLATRRLRI